MSARRRAMSSASFRRWGLSPHYRVPVDVDTQGGEALGEDLGVGVCDVAQKQLRAHGDEFRGVCHALRLPQILASSVTLTRTQVSPAMALATRPSTSSTASAARTASRSGRVAG